MLTIVGMTWNAPFPLLPGEDLKTLKLRFAELKVKFPAARDEDLIQETLGGDPRENVGRVYQFKQLLGNDLEVAEMILSIKATGTVSKEKSPDEETFASEVLAFTRATHDPKDKLIGFKLYAELKGYLKKESTNVNVAVAVTNKVMKVTAAASDEEWERRLEAQQAKLINVTPTTLN
jgi:hypothetical protein